MEITIIIPSRNEENVIIKTLDKLAKEVITPHQILIIDDSTDKTAEKVRQYSLKYPEVSLIKGDPNKKSFARALAVGFKKAKTKAVVVVMADLCDDPKTIDKMYDKFQKGWDIVCGSRYMKGGKKIGGPIIQALFSYLICKILYLFSGIPTQDVSNAFKMYRLDALRKIKFNLSGGVETSMEITLQAFFNGAKITEIPTIWKGRVFGQSKFSILHRSPKYAQIIFWTLGKSIRKTLRIK